MFVLDTVTAVCVKNYRSNNLIGRKIMPVISDRLLTFICTNLRPLVNKFGDPFIIHHGPEIRDRLRGMNSDFRGFKLDFTELFALKANPRLAIFKDFIMTEGCGADCSSDAELSFAEEVGLPGELIMLTANNVPEELYRHAMRLGAHINFDDVTCFAKVPKPFPRRASLRMNLGKGQVLSPGEEEGKIEFNREGSKFGIPVGEIMSAYEVMINDYGVEEVGSHSMMVSNNLDYRKVIHIIQKQADFLSEAVDKFGVRAPYINVGGGLGIAYRLEDPDYDVKALAREVARIIGAFKAKHGYAPKVFMESGRFVTGSSAVLVNKIQNIYTKFGHKFLGVQIAMHAMPRPMLYPGEAYHHQIIVRADGTLKDGPLEKVSIVGSACEDNDRVATDIMLPRAEEGDYVISCSAGAHSVDQASDYNWQFKPQELLIGDHDNVRRICSQQTYAGLTARQRGLEGEEHVLHIR
jgi:diaminopimelate decarboxylase